MLVRAAVIPRRNAKVWIPAMKDVCVWQTWLTTKRDAPRFDWTIFDNITFTDKESTGIDEKNREFIRKWRIWVRV